MLNLKTQNKPKNLRTGCHFYNEKMEFDVYNGEASDNNTIKILDLSIEYPEYKDDIPYAIVTNLSDDEIKEQLGKEIEQYSPYVTITPPKCTSSATLKAIASEPFP